MDKLTLELYKDIIIKDGDKKLNDIKKSNEEFCNSLDQRISDLMNQLNEENDI